MEPERQWMLLRDLAPKCLHDKEKTKLTWIKTLHALLISALQIRVWCETLNSWYRSFRRRPKALIPVLPFHKVPSSRWPYKFSRSLSKERAASHAVNLIKEKKHLPQKHPAKTSQIFLMAYHSNVHLDFLSFPFWQLHMWLLRSC